MGQKSSKMSKLYLSHALVVLEWFSNHKKVQLQFSLSIMQSSTGI